MMALSNHFFYLFSRWLSFVLKCSHFAYEFLIALALPSSLHLFWIYQVFCQPLAVAQTQSAQHVKNVFK